MNDMLDAMLAALPDQAYFEQRDFGTSLRDTLLAAEEPYGCYLRGAKVWDLSKHPNYPFYSVCKTNTVDNTVFIPFRNATRVLSSVETGELILKAMRDDEGKIPLAEEPKPTRPHRPGVPRAKTYGADDLWRTIPARDLSGDAGVYRAFLHAGNFQSAAFEFHVVPKKPSHQPIPSNPCSPIKPVRGPKFDLSRMFYSTLFPAWNLQRAEDWFSGPESRLCAMAW